MSSDPYGQPPEDKPNFSKHPSGEPTGPAGLGDPPQQPSWGDPNYGQPSWTDPSSGQPGYGQPDPSYGQPYSTQPYPAGPPEPSGPSFGAQPYPEQSYGYQPPPYGSPPPGPMPPPYSPYYPMPSQSNGLAVAALVTGICGFICCVPGLAAIGLGVAGLSESKRTGIGRGMSIAGITLGSVWVLLGIGWLIVTVATRG